MFHITSILRVSVLPLLLLSLVACAQGDVRSAAFSDLTPQQMLGKKLFFDVRLSEPAGQSCASCHSPNTGFADPSQTAAVSPGARGGRFSNRNAMAVAYAAFTPALHFDEDEKLYIGGLFWDGRVHNLTEQAKKPFLNPLEMANNNKTQVVNKVKQADYFPEFVKVYGEQALIDTETGYDQIAEAIAAYEASREVNPFTSKYDYYLAGKVKLTPQELRGLKLYEAEDKGNCAACHPSQPSEDNQLPLFTDFSYDNLGVPRNEQNPFYTQDAQFNPAGKQYVDLGLGAIVKDKNEDGKFKVPTLRNIALSAPYMHNGVFTTLTEVVDFYNTRDVKKWPPAEVTENVNKEELGDLKLTSQEVEDIVVFMKTLSDGYSP